MTWLKLYPCLVYIAEANSHVSLVDRQQSCCSGADSDVTGVSLKMMLTRLCDV